MFKCGCLARVILATGVSQPELRRKPTETTRTTRLGRLSVVAFLVASIVGGALVYAKEKKGPVGPGDPTYRLFQLLDNSYGGKLSDYCLLADTYPDPNHPGQMLQHVLQLDYDKSRFFGRFRVYVRGVSPLTQAQLKEYTLQQIYGFGSDVEKFEKIDPGPLGETGDVYCRTTGNGTLNAVTITDDAKREYEFFLTQYVLPAPQKK